MVSAVGSSYGSLPYAGLQRSATGRGDFPSRTGGRGGDAATGLPGDNAKKAAEKDAKATAAVTTERGQDGKPLNDSEKEAVKELRDIDREVRAHEQAHLTAGGSYARGPYFEYEVGPDGKRYAVAGSVNIDTSSIPNNPSATLAKLDQVIRAATAPGDPSGQDQQVASQARQAKLQAQSELNAQRQAQFGGSTDARRPAPANNAGRGGLLDISA